MPLCGDCRRRTTPRRRCEGALRTVFGVDSQLIADGTYLVAEALIGRRDRLKPADRGVRRME